MLAVLDGVDKSAVLVSLFALIPGVLAYVRGRRTDRRVNDLDTLRTMVESLQWQNNEIQERLDRCEDDRSKANIELLEMRSQILQLRNPPQER